VSRAALIVLLFAVVACSRTETPKLNRPAIPAGWPGISAVDDNPWNAERAELGKELFFEPLLSNNRNVSCATCHQPATAWTVNEDLIMGTEGTRFFRHPPSLLNVGFFTSWHWDGGTTSLEKQVLAPLENPDEMNMRADSLILRLRRDAYYRDRFMSVYGKEPDMYGVTRSLGAYQRSLISARSKWDRVETGNEALTEVEARGQDLFFSDSLACSECHVPPLFTDLLFHNNGRWQWGDFDPGRSRVTLDSLDRGKFKTPTLRNVAVTRPYFHDGSAVDLESVLVHYENGGNGNQLQDSRIRSFQLSHSDRSAILTFIMTLTDTSSMNDPQLKP